MKRTAAIALAALSLTACAKRSNAIMPTPIPVENYTRLSCDDLKTQYVHERAVLEQMEKNQNRAATGDAVGVFLVGLPVSSALGGDREGSVSVQKGKVLAMESAIAQKGC